MATTVFRRGETEGLTGYDAKVALDLLARYPETTMVVVSDDAPTRAGYQIVRHAVPTVPVYYRKSSGGRWGRSVQVLRVVPAVEGRTDR